MDDGKAWFAKGEENMTTKSYFKFTRVDGLHETCSSTEHNKAPRDAVAVLAQCFQLGSLGMLDVTHVRKRVDAITVKSRMHGREDKGNNSGGDNQNAKT